MSARLATHSGCHSYKISLVHLSWSLQTRGSPRSRVRHGSEMVIPVSSTRGSLVGYGAGVRCGNLPASKSITG